MVLRVLQTCAKDAIRLVVFNVHVLYLQLFFSVPGISLVAYVTHFLFLSDIIGWEGEKGENGVDSGNSGSWDARTLSTSNRGWDCNVWGTPEWKWDVLERRRVMSLFVSLCTEMMGSEFTSPTNLQARQSQYVSRWLWMCFWGTSSHLTGALGVKICYIVSYVFVFSAANVQFHTRRLYVLN